MNRPNAFNLTAVLEPQVSFANHFAKTLANGNRLAILANLTSGDAANITSSNPTLNNDASTSVGSVGRPAFVVRNTLRGFAVYQVDARYTRTFKLFDRLEPSFLLEANNIFNHNNLTGLTVTQATQAFVVGGTATQNANAGCSTAALAAGLGCAANVGLTGQRSTVLESRIVQWGAALRF